MSQPQITPMTLDDYDEVQALWVRIILFVLKDNPDGVRFWEALGWATRDHVIAMLK